MKAACMNAVRIRLYSPSQLVWNRCGWQGEVADLDQPCPRCGNKGRLEPVGEVPRNNAMLCKKCGAGLSGLPTVELQKVRFSPCIEGDHEWKWLIPEVEVPEVGGVE